MATKLPVPFTPAQLRPRHDGWTAQRQIAFVEALAETACVEEACRRVGSAARRTVSDCSFAALDSSASSRARTRRLAALAAFRANRPCAIQHPER